MDPITLKYIQLIVTQILGAGLMVCGLIMLFRGLSGKSTLLVEGASLKAKLTNASPGTIVLVIGLALVFISVNWKVEGRESEALIHDVTRLEEWKQMVNSLKGDENYITIRDRLLSKPGSRTREEYKQLNQDSSLGEMSTTFYGNDTYWKLLAAINIDREYIDFAKATQKTSIPMGSLVEAWFPSKYELQNRERIITIATEDARVAYEELLEMAKNSTLTPQTSTIELDKKFKSRELRPVQSPPSDRTLSLRELALKYYGEVRFWKIIKSMNSDIPNTATETWVPPEDVTIYVYHFVPLP